jgi:hypothetical protein
VDLYKAIDELRAEWRKVDRMIADLEAHAQRQAKPARKAVPARSTPKPRPAAAVAAHPAQDQPVTGMEISEDMVRFWRENPPESSGAA